MVRALGRIGFLTLLGACAFVPGARAGDAEAGRSVFQRCAICHSVEKDGANGLGPNLFGVVDRKAGTVPGFAYSPAMQGAGFAWTPDKLADYLAHPAETVPGNRMAFAGLTRPEQIDDLVAYLETLK